MKYYLVFLYPIIYFGLSWFLPWDAIQWDSSISVTYIFDIFFATSVYLIHKPRLTFRLTKGVMPRGLALAATAFLSIFICLQLGLLTPFRYVDNLFIQILILAPIIEELVFRYALFEPFKLIIPNKNMLFIFNGLLFSLSHGKALTVLPTDFHSFIYFQMGYTFLLGWICSKAKFSSGSILEPILLHFTFNLIFYYSVTNYNL